MFQKWFDVDVLGFQVELCNCRYLGLFWLGGCLGYFLKNFVIFFKSCHPEKEKHSKHSKLNGLFVLVFTKLLTTILRPFLGRCILTNRPWLTNVTITLTISDFKPNCKAFCEFRTVYENDYLRVPYNNQKQEMSRVF